MSEQTAEQTDDTQQTDQGNPDEASLGDAGKKALDAMKGKWKDAEKQAALLQTQLDAINQANETALEKAQRELQEHRDAATLAASEALRYRIAAETGITDNVDLILTAGDEQTMRAQAALWSTRTSTGPKPDLTQGAQGGSPAATDPAAAFGNFILDQRNRR